MLGQIIKFETQICGFLDNKLKNFRKLKDVSKLNPKIFQKLKKPANTLLSLNAKKRRKKVWFKLFLKRVRSFESSWRSGVDFGARFHWGEIFYFIEDRIDLHFRGSTYLLSGLDSLAWTLLDQLPPLSRDPISSCLTNDVVMLTPRSVNSWSPKLTPSCFTQPKRSKLSPCQNKNTTRCSLCSIFYVPTNSRQLRHRPGQPGALQVRHLPWAVLLWAENGWKLAEK